MDLFNDILTKFFLDAGKTFTFPNPPSDLLHLVESTCYRALQNIKAVVEDDSLDDIECFMKIEEIIHILEELGSDGGSRHDFG